MPQIAKCTSGKEVVDAHAEFERRLPADSKYDGHRQIAKNVKNGMPLLFKAATGSGTEFYKMTDDEGVVGLLRIEVRPDNVHIDNVVALIGTKHLVNFAKSRAVELSRTKVHLSAADPGLPDYYKALGFQMVNPRAETGEMIASAFT